jgi:hypothetical protein
VDKLVADPHCDDYERSEGGALVDRYRELLARPELVGSQSYFHWWDETASWEEDIRKTLV